jgi:hypothetical protein
MDFKTTKTLRHKAFEPATEIRSNGRDCFETIKYFYLLSLSENVVTADL